MPILLLLTLVTPAQAIIIRHDVSPDRYEIKADEFPAVFFIEQQGRSKVCGATVIHQRWALTAAHCVYETMLGETVDAGRRFAVEVDGRSREVDFYTMHPNFDVTSRNDVDLALLRFRQHSQRPAPMPLQIETDEQGQVLSLLGWGYFGRGTTGRTHEDGRLRLAQNRVETAARRLRLIFDDPRIRGSHAEELEGTPGLGDSGGPALLLAEPGYALAGIAVGEVGGSDFTEDSQGKYGAVAIYERVSLHINWIEAVIGSDYPFDS